MASLGSDELGAGGSANESVPSPNNSMNSVELDAKLLGLSCTTYFDGLIFCTTPTNQLTSYYRHGRLDDCADAIKNLQTCMRIKFAKISNKEKAKKMLKMSTLKKSSTVGTVWEARDEPSLKANPVD